MARPIKENADYHTHDKDMRNDLKIKALRTKWGYEGYAIYNMMLEVLTDSAGFKHEWNDLNIELLSADFGTTNLAEIISYCTDILKLFTIDNGYIYSSRHRERMAPLLSKRKRQQKGVIDADNTHSKVKESKVKESIIPPPQNSGPGDQEETPQNQSTLKKQKKEESDFVAPPAAAGWNQRPGQDQYELELPDMKAGAVIELLGVTKGIKATREQVRRLWEVFKIQHFTGEKFYQSPAEAYKHFINWSRGQPITEIQKGLQEPKISARLQKGNEIHEKLYGKKDQQ
jgi:hypothetical protein